MPEIIPIRASSLGELFDCPARWEAKHIRKLRYPRSASAQIGTAVHAGTALFDQSVLDHNPLSAEEAAGAVVDTIYKPQEDIQWDDITQNEAEKIAIPLHKLYCSEIAPKQEYAAIEAKCEELVLTDIGISLTGIVDRVRSTDFGYGIADIKTGKTAVKADGTVETKGHAAQMAVYELLVSHSLSIAIEAPAQIIGLQAAKTDKGRRAATAEIESARELLLDDEENPGLLRHAAGIVHSGDFYGNPRSALCSEKYCPAFPNCRWRR